ncbi:zinc-ribbon domain-containing protein [Klebsiella pneumoniae]
MALVKCKECGKEVAQSAKTCPHCGVATPYVQQKGGCLSLIVLVAVIAFIVSRCDDTEEKKPCDQSDGACLAESHKHTAWLECQKYIKKSAQYEYEFTDNFIDGGFTRFVYDNNGKISYFGDKVKFSNAFNAKKTMNYLCVYDIKTKTIVDFSISQ